MWFCWIMSLWGLVMALLNYPKHAKQDRSCFYYWGTYASIWGAATAIIGALK